MSPFGISPDVLALTPATALADERAKQQLSMQRAIQGARLDLEERSLSLAEKRMKLEARQPQEARFRPFEEEMALKLAGRAERRPVGEEIAIRGAGRRPLAEELAIRRAGREQPMTPEEISAWESEGWTRGPGKRWLAPKEEAKPAKWQLLKEAQDEALKKVGGGWADLTDEEAAVEYDNLTMQIYDQYLRQFGYGAEEATLGPEYEQAISILTKKGYSREEADNMLRGQ